jgi:hypothetical protein
MTTRLLPFTLLLLVLCVSGAGAAAEPLLRVRLLLSNPAPYVGEEVVQTLEVRYRQHPGGRLTLSWPQPDGCLVEELPPLPPRREETAEGSELVEVARRRLRPIAPGRIALPGAVVVQGRLLAAAPQQLRVRPLPAAGRPREFAGAVGSAALELRAAGEGTREVTLTLRGDAPLDAFPAPLAATGRGERLIPVGEELHGDAGGERQRVWRYLYLPGDGRRGHLAFSLALFDPATGRYRELRAALPGESGPWPAAGGVLGVLLLAALALLRAHRRRRRCLARELERALGRPAAGLGRDDILAALRRRRCEEALLARLDRFWQAQDLARFGPAPASLQAPLPEDEGALATALAQSLPAQVRAAGRPTDRAG